MPQLAMSAFASCILLSLPLHLAHCCCRKLGLKPPAPSCAITVLPTWYDLTIPGAASATCAPALATYASSLPLPCAARNARRPPVRVRHLRRACQPSPPARARCRPSVSRGWVARHVRRRQRPPPLARLPARGRCHPRLAVAFRAFMKSLLTPGGWRRPRPLAM